MRLAGRTTALKFPASLTGDFNEEAPSHEVPVVSWRVRREHKSEFPDLVRDGRQLFWGLRIQKQN